MLRLPKNTSEGLLKRRIGFRAIPGGTRQITWRQFAFSG
jgi:hypothetical protein